jgi:DNA-directed RNA polymerase subunit RPC12/RpoP
MNHPRSGEKVSCLTFSPRGGRWFICNQTGKLTRYPERVRAESRKPLRPVVQHPATCETRRYQPNLTVNEQKQYICAVCGAMFDVKPKFYGDCTVCGAIGGVKLNPRSQSPVQKMQYKCRYCGKGHESRPDAGRCSACYTYYAVEFDSSAATAF